MSRERVRRMFFLGFLVLLRLFLTVAMRSASLVHQDPDPAPLRKGPLESQSSFVAAAAKAAAEVDVASSNSDLATVQSDVSWSVAVTDVSLNVPEYKELGARAVTVVGERARLIVAGTVDGQVHALDPVTGDERWSFSSGEPLLKCYQQSPGALDEKRWLIPNIDGSLLVYTPQGLGRAGLNPRSLVEATPFIGLDYNMYYGSKISRIFGVDAKTGEVRQVLAGDTVDILESDRKLLAASDNEDDMIWIGRVDRTLRAFDLPSAQELWNVTIGEFVSLDGLLRTSSDPAGAHGSRSEMSPHMVAAPDGSLQLTYPTSMSKGSAQPSGTSSSPSWNIPLSAHVSNVFLVDLEEGSSFRYRPLQVLQLSQSGSNSATPVAARGAASGGGGVGGGAAGVGGTSGLRGSHAAVGMLGDGQLYAVALDEVRSQGEEGVDGAGGVAVGGCGTGRNDGGRGGGGGGKGALPRGRGKSRSGESKHGGGRVSTTQPLLAADSQKCERDATDYAGSDVTGTAHGVPSTLMPVSKGMSAALRSCQPGHANFPDCLSGVHPIQNIGDEQIRSLPQSFRVPELKPPDVNEEYPPPVAESRDMLDELFSWLYRGWSVVSLGLLVVTVVVVIDSRTARFLKQMGLGGYPFYPNEDIAVTNGAYELNPHGVSGRASDASSNIEGRSVVSAARGSTGTDVRVASELNGGTMVNGVKGEVRVGCLTVSDEVLGYGSHGTVVYRGLLEGRPVAVKRMLKDFHARADREISLLIESDGHPNVVRYFVREEAGEFVYLALQLCQLSLHNAVGQIYAAMAQVRREADVENGGQPSAPRLGLGRGLAREDVTAPPELRAALLQVSHGVEHLHSLRIVHRDLKPHNILLASKDRKGPGLGRKVEGDIHGDGSRGKSGENGSGDEGLKGNVPRKLSRMDDLANYELKISDMGLGKQLLNGQSSFGLSSYGRMPGCRDESDASMNGGVDELTTARASKTHASPSAGGHVGSIGWQAPEVIADRVRMEGEHGMSLGTTDSTLGFPGRSSSTNVDKTSVTTLNGPVNGGGTSRRTQAVDIFALGCIFHHCIVPGSHPFGQWYEREANIMQDRATYLMELSHIPDAHDLVSLMTARDPDMRPSAGEVCRHPFFWNEDRRLSFLLEFSDRLEQDAVQSPLLVMVESGADRVVGRSWDVRLDPELTEDAGRYRKYDFSSVRDLLRVVRNKRHHFHELPERVQKFMSPLPAGFLRYVEERFPQLLMHCAKVTGALLSDERIFKEYLVPFHRPLPPSVARQFGSLALALASASASAPSPLRSLPSPKLPTPSPSPQASPSPTIPGPLPSPSRELPVAPRSSVSEDRASDGGFGLGETEENEPIKMTQMEANTPESDKTAVSLDKDITAPLGEGEAIERRRGEKPMASMAEPTGVNATPSLPMPVRSSGSDPSLSGQDAHQQGPRGDGALAGVLLWNESAMAKSMGCRGWWRHQEHWSRRLDVSKQRPRGAHLNKALQDPKYRTRLCSHWENSQGTSCPMRKRGPGKCDFAHGGIELRVRANKREKWGRNTGADGMVSNPDASGGEDTLGAARSIGRIRMENGTRDGAGSAVIAAALSTAGGVVPGSSTAGGNNGGTRQGKRPKGSDGSGQGGGGGTPGWQGREPSRAATGGMNEPPPPQQQQQQQQHPGGYGSDCIHSPGRGSRAAKGQGQENNWNTRESAGAANGILSPRRAGLALPQEPGLHGDAVVERRHPSQTEVEGGRDTVAPFSFSGPLSRNGGIDPSEHALHPRLHAEQNGELCQDRF